MVMMTRACVWREVGGGGEGGGGGMRRASTNQRHPSPGRSLVRDMPPEVAGGGQAHMGVAVFQTKQVGEG